MNETGQETKPSETKSIWSRRWFWTGGALLAGAAALAATAPAGPRPSGPPLGRTLHGGFGDGGHGAFAAQILSDPAAAKEHVATMSETSSCAA